MMLTPKIVLPAIACLMVLFSACPVGVEAPAGDKGKEKIDAQLIGTWTSDDDESELSQVKITKATAYSYTIEVTVPGSMYSLTTTTLTGWVTTIDGQKFLYAKPSDEEKYYLYQYEFNDGKLTTHDVSLKVEGIDAAKATDTYREEIKQSLKFSDCLSGPLNWAKE